MGKMLDDLKKKLEHPEVIERMKKHYKDIQDKKERNIKRARLFFNDEKSFETFLLKLIDKHDQRWEDVCYNNGYQPHPWNLMYGVLYIVQRGGDEVMPVDDLTRNFSSLLMKYNDFTFAWTFGQGTCISIFDKNNELIYRT